MQRVMKKIKRGRELMSNIFNYRNNVLYFTPEVPGELYPNGVEQRTILIPMQVYRVSIPERKIKR